MKTKKGREITPDFQEGFEDAIADLRALRTSTEYLKGWYAGKDKLERRMRKGQYD